MTAARVTSRIAGACLLALILGGGVAACGSDPGERPRAGAPTSNAEATSVKIALFRFQPKTRRVPAGTTVTWHNDDAILHTVTAGLPGQPTGDFDEELADKGASASVRFDRPGTFTYFCARHPEAMRGEVTVTT